MVIRSMRVKSRELGVWGLAFGDARLLGMIAL